MRERKKEREIKRALAQILFRCLAIKSFLLVCNQSFFFLLFYSESEKEWKFRLIMAEF